MSPIWFGTSGFSYKEWKGPFYPPGLPAAKMLEFYASRFNSVEIDSTFYRMPTMQTLEGWCQATPPEFRFIIKAGRRITHSERLQAPSPTLSQLTGLVPLLGPRLGLVLYQLPPFLRLDLPCLEAFLASLPDPRRSALEFRHDSWLTDEVFVLLERYGAVFCIHDGDEQASPHRVTGGAVYVRLRKTVYSTAERHAWQSRLREWSGSGLDVFAYIKHKDNPGAPGIALEFAAPFR